MFEVVVEGSSLNVVDERVERLLRGVALEVRDLAFGGVSHVFGGVVVGCVRG